MHVNWKEIESQNIVNAKILDFDIAYDACITEKDGEHGIQGQIRPNARIYISI